MKFWMFTFSVVVLLSSSSCIGLNSGCSHNLTGTYATSCFSAGGVYIRSYMILTCDTLYGDSRYYSDAGCTTEIYSRLSTSSLNVGDTISVASGTGSASKINYTLSTVTFTPKTSAQVTTFNTDVECGFSNWSLNSEKVVTGLTCTNLGTQPSSGLTGYDLMQKNTSVTPATLALGDSSTGNGSSEGTRPTDIDPSSLLTEQ